MIQAISGFALAAIALFHNGRSLLRRVNSQTGHERYVGRPDLASSPLEMIAEVLTMRDRFAANAILFLLRVSSGLSSTFLDR